MKTDCIMKQKTTRLIIAATLLCAAATTMAQDLKTAYYTDEFFYRHDMNPAFGNDRGYVSFPALGITNLNLQGNIGADNLLFKNPNPGGKKTVTFMHPDISYEQAMKGFKDNRIRTIGNVRETVLSLGFNAWGGYNTFEINGQAMVGVSLPKSIFSFAKRMKNDTYTFDEIGAQAYGYGEAVIGHSRDFGDKLRVGLKLKYIAGIGRAKLSADGMKAVLGKDANGQDVWYLEGQAKAEVNVDGFRYVTEQAEYNSATDPKTGQPRSTMYYDKVKEVDLDDFSGSTASGFGADLGAIYKVTDDLTVNAAVLNLGFIKWKKTSIAQTPGGRFEFKGFHDIAVNDDYSQQGESLDDQADSYSDQLSDFFNLETRDDDGSATTSLAATINLGAEYKMPFWDNLSAGLLLSRHFDGSNFSWNEARLSVNLNAGKHFSASVSGAVNSFGTSFGWVLNLHTGGPNIFLAMDHMSTKLSSNGIPLRPNFNLAFGVNIAWGSHKKVQARKEAQRAQLLEEAL